MISTKIVATIGPASDSVETLQELYDSGMRVARLNFSHGNHAYFTKVIRNIRKVSKEIAIMLDTKGPEIRTGEVENGEIELCSKDTIRLTAQKVLGNKKEITVDYHDLKSVSVGSIVLIDDGLIETKVVKKKGDNIYVKVLNGGKLGNRKSVIMRGHDPDIGFLSSKDKEDITFGVEQRLDFIAVSYVKTANDIVEIKKVLSRKSSPMKVVSKIEHWKALDNLSAIIDESHGIMVARGDLGVEIPMEQIPKLQKDIVTECNKKGKPVIVATQMLESMKENPIPTRAEIADVAQAIIEGADAIMLSAETASGKFPVKAVQAMRAVAREYDDQVELNLDEEAFQEVKKPVSTFVTKAAYLASEELKCGAILTPTESGFTARKVSRFKPKCPIFAVARTMEVVRQLQLSWGVYPILSKKKFSSQGSMARELITRLHKDKKVAKKDLVVVTSGHVMGKPGHTNVLEIYRVKNIIDSPQTK